MQNMGNKARAQMPPRVEGMGDLETTAANSGEDIFEKPDLTQAYGRGPGISCWP